MRTLRWRLAAAGLARCPPAATRADDASAAMERLFQLVGKWKVDEVYAQDDQGNRPTGKGDASFRKELDDTMVVGEYKTKSRDMGSDVEGILMFSFDPKRNQYRHWWFDNYGNFYDQFAAEYSTSSQELRFIQDTYDDHGKPKGKAQFTYRFLGNGDIAFSMAFGDSPSSLETLMEATFSPRGRKDDATNAPPPAAPRTARPMSGG